MLTKSLIRLCFEAIMSRSDPESVNYLQQLRRQAATRQKGVGRELNPSC